MAATTHAQQSDSTHVQTTLGEVVVEGAVRGNRISAMGVDKREIISTVGLKKMACCTLAESFENSASVSVGYSDAVSGARQIRMLGLAGVYTQFLDESRPFMRGLVSPYALNYTPGDWLHSIQVSKGVASVAAGHEAITGQINLDYRKPTDDERLHLNFYLDDMLRPEVNLTSAIHFTDDKSLSTIVMAHGSLDTDWREMGAMDRDHDGFRDLPSTRQIDVANRWVWLAPNGAQLRWGAKYTAERRKGGQMHDMGNIYDDVPTRYLTDVTNHDASAYVKAAVPLRHTIIDSLGNALQDNAALIADWNHFDTRSSYGLNRYNAHENQVSLALRLDHYFTPASTLAAGVQGRMSFVRGQALWRAINDALLWHEQTLANDLDERELGSYAEWTLTMPRLTLVTGLRADYNDWADRLLLTPRMHLKWDLTPSTVLRASAGLGYRTPRAIIENLGILATGYAIVHNNDFQRVEKALTAGGSLTQTFTLGHDRNASLSLDYFHTHFYRALIATQEPWPHTVALLSSDGKNCTNTFQLDFNWTPVERLEVFATMRQSLSSLELPRLANMPEGLVRDGSFTTSRALINQFKGVLNVSYATRFRVWVFDVTAQLNGPARIPGNDAINDGGAYHSPTYAQLFAQVTHKIGTAEIYAGCENITDYRQRNPIIAPDAPFSTHFNSLNVWGPLMGRRFYVGMRWNLY